MTIRSSDPGLSLRSNPGLKLAHAYGVDRCRVVKISARLRHCSIAKAELAHAFGIMYPT